MHPIAYNVHATLRNMLIKTVGRFGLGRFGHDFGPFCTCDGPF